MRGRSPHYTDGPVVGTKIKEYFSFANFDGRTFISLGELSRLGRAWRWLPPEETRKKKNKKKKKAKNQETNGFVIIMGGVILDRGFPS